MPAMIVLLVLIGGYAALSHYSEVTEGATGLATALSIGPVLLIGAVLLWRWGRPILALPVTLAGAAALYFNWAFLENNYEWANLLQQCGAYALVAVAFAVSLLPGRVPLCTQIDQKLHPELTAVELRYTRLATVAWAAFYLAITLSIGILFFTATKRVWSLYTNFGTFAAIALACVLDYALRLRLLPQRGGSGLRAILQRVIFG